MKSRAGRQLREAVFVEPDQRLAADFANAPTMAGLGLGLLWLFPCDLEVDETIRLVHLKGISIIYQEQQSN